MLEDHPRKPLPSQGLNGRTQQAVKDIIDDLRLSLAHYMLYRKLIVGAYCLVHFTLKSPDETIWPPHG